MRACEDAGWEASAPEPVPGRRADAPLLDGARLEVDSRLARRWVARLVGAAADGEGPEAASLAAATRRDALDPLALLEAALMQDEARLEALALGVGADVRALGAVAQLAVIPLLQACGRGLAPHAPAEWPHGYCPLCGAWPSLAELRGLERARRLRCSRCGGDWRVDLLRCPYCRTDDFRQLGSLVPEERGENRKADTCGACRGYVKALTTLRPIPPTRVALEDLGSVELDVVALERDFRRPSPPGYRLDVAVAPSSARRGLLGWRR
jgi:FdhE protein